VLEIHTTACRGRGSSREVGTRFVGGIAGFDLQLPFSTVMVARTIALALRDAP